LSVDVAALHRFFKQRERLSMERISVPTALRLDGVGFGKALKGFESPRDIRVHRALVDACRVAMQRFGADFCYVVSDELNIFFVKREPPYGGRILKLCTVASSLVSSVVSLELGKNLLFDARVIELEPSTVVDYLLYRMRVGFGNYVTKLYRLKVAPPREGEPLERLLKELEARNLLSFDWRAYGTCLALETVVRKAIDRIRCVEVEVVRRRIVEISDPSKCVEKLIETTTRADDEPLPSTER